MKKFVLSLSVVFALGMVSCGDSKKDATIDSLNAVDSLDSIQQTNQVDENVTDENEGLEGEDAETPDSTLEVAEVVEEVATGAVETTASSNETAKNKGKEVKSTVVTSNPENTTGAEGDGNGTNVNGAEGDGKGVDAVIEDNGNGDKDSSGRGENQKEKVDQQTGNPTDPTPPTEGSN